MTGFMPILEFTASSFIDRNCEMEYILQKFRFSSLKEINVIQWQRRYIPQPGVAMTECN